MFFVDRPAFPLSVGFRVLDLSRDAATHMSKTRVEELCSRDKRIKRNEKEKESWRLV